MYVIKNNNTNRFISIDDDGEFYDVSLEYAEVFHSLEVVEEYINIHNTENWGIYNLKLHAFPYIK